MPVSSNYIAVNPNSIGLKVDTSELTSGVNTVERQNICISDPSTAANVATVTSGAAVKTSNYASNGTIATIAPTTASTILLTANALRVGATLLNSGTVTVFVGLGITPTTSSYHFQLAPNAYWEAPYNWTGAINGIVASTTGSVLVGSFT
jgi:hypothetical protein